MQKIPTLFVRDMTAQPALVTDEVNPDCMWVFREECRATVKWDGTCTMLDDRGFWWSRREVKPGKAAPQGFVPSQHDSMTGKTVGWEPIAQASHIKAFDSIHELPHRPGTYELCGPKVNGNPHDFVEHVLLLHGDRTAFVPDRHYDALRVALEDFEFEGIVWWHADGRRAKLKRRDFGFPWPTTKLRRVRG